MQVPFIALLGAGPLAYGLPFWLAGAAGAPLAYLIGRDAGFERLASAVAGGLVAIPAGLSALMAQPDSFGLFLTLGALALWLCARGTGAGGRVAAGPGGPAAFALGGLVVGPASLARADRVLLGVPFVLAFATERRHGGRPGDAAGGGIGWRGAAGSAAGFLLVIGPWWLRQLATFGTLSTAAGHSLWITRYTDFFSVTADPTPATVLAQGLGPLLVSRAGGLVAAVGLFAYQGLAVVLAPAYFLGVLRHRRDPAFRPWLVYGLTLTAVSALLFAPHVPSGSFLHSAVALLPGAYLLTAAGVAAAVEAVARRRRHWDPPRATRNLTLLAAGVAVVFAVATSASTIAAWQRDRVARAPLVAARARAPAGGRLLSADPAGYLYLTGRAGVATPADDLATLHAVAVAYGVRWLALDADAIVASLEPVLDGSVRPGWLSAPVAVGPAAGGCPLRRVPRAGGRPL